MKDQFAYNSNTFCAISTPRGSGAIAVIRLNGPEVFSVVNKIFTPYSDTGKKVFEHKKAIYGKITEDEKILDEVQGYVK